MEYIIYCTTNKFDGYLNIQIKLKIQSIIKQTGRPIYIGPGLIPQIEAYADKYAYNKMTVDVLNTIVTTMAQKANNPKLLGIIIEIL